MSSFHQRLWCNYSINTENCQKTKPSVYTRLVISPIRDLCLNENRPTSRHHHLAVLHLTRSVSTLPQSQVFVDTHCCHDNPTHSHAAQRLANMHGSQTGQHYLVQFNHCFDRLTIREPLVLPLEHKRQRNVVDEQ